MNTSTLTKFLVVASMNIMAINMGRRDPMRMNVSAKKKKRKKKRRVAVKLVNAMMAKLVSKMKMVLASVSRILPPPQTLLLQQPQHLRQQRNRRPGSHRPHNHHPRASSAVSRMVAELFKGLKLR